ncbi:MAG TPA: rhodanese-like domain-containing protein [Rhodothermales bacterium]|nr:rhodanese-like domain-containing protein [Rhodothermales bacterium]
MHFFQHLLAIVLLAASLLVGGCARQVSNTADTSEVAPSAEIAVTKPIERLAPAAFLAQRRATDVVLDVRTPDEYEAGHLQEALNIDVLADDFRALVDALDRERTYYLYCRSGNRSQRAAEIMQEMGFRSLYNVGGFDALAQAGADTVAE